MESERKPWLAERYSRNGDLFGTALAVGGIVVLALLAWQLMNVFLLAFAAIVIASILIALADLIRRVLPLSQGWAVGVAVLAVVLATGAFSMFMGAQVSGQVADLFNRLPREIAAFGDMIGVPDLADRITTQIGDFAGRGNVLLSIAGYTTGILGIAADIFLVLVASIYVAQRPELYRRGALALFPANVRHYVGPATKHAGRALRLWLLGQLASMVIVGVAVGVGLWLIGVPSALALGLFAGLAEFVPVVGPIVSAVPGLLLALPEGNTTVLWVLALYVVIQQFESNVIVPIIQRHAVELPPALGLFALVALSVLFGPLGMLLSTPLTVVLFVAVKELYVRDTLKQETEVPGESPDAAHDG